MPGMNIYGELYRAQLERVIADPTPAVPSRVLWNSVTGKFIVDSGSAIRPVLINDDKCWFGNAGAGGAVSASNVRVNRSAAGTIQFLLGNDATAEGSASTSGTSSAAALAQVDKRVLNAAASSLPPVSASTIGRFAFVTDEAVPAYDNGSAWVRFAPAVDESYQVRNVALAVSVASNILTIALKTKALTDASVTDPIKISFRNVTSATGDYVQRSVTAALSLTISSGSTLGLGSSLGEYVYIYAIDNGGTVVLAAVGGAAVLAEGEVQSTTAEGGAGAADTRYTGYSTAAQTSKSCRLLGRVKFTTGASHAAGTTWVSGPTEISLTPFNARQTGRSEIVVTTGNGHGVSTSTAIRAFSTLEVNTGTDITRATASGTGDTFTINRDGIYAMQFDDSKSTGVTNIGISLNSSQLTTAILSITAADRLSATGAESGRLGSVYACRRLKVGDVIRFHDTGDSDATTLCKASIVRVGD